MHFLASNRLRSLEEGRSLGSRVVAFIEKRLGKEACSLEDVASHFNMTPRTLQRKLRLEASSFAQLRDHCRHTRALRELADPLVDVDLLAVMLGFSDSSNFYHAFKRWEGLSPGAYRREVLRQRGFGGDPE
jgi:AraC-like DNA-binding protein